MNSNHINVIEHEDHRAVLHVLAPTEHEAVDLAQSWMNEQNFHLNPMSVELQPIQDSDLLNNGEGSTILSYYNISVEAGPVSQQAKTVTFPHLATESHHDAI